MPCQRAVRRRLRIHFERKMRDDELAVHMGQQGAERNRADRIVQHLDAVFAEARVRVSHGYAINPFALSVARAASEVETSCPRLRPRLKAGVYVQGERSA